MTHKFTLNERRAIIIAAILAGIFTLMAAWTTQAAESWTPNSNGIPAITPTPTFIPAGSYSNAWEPIIQETNGIEMVYVPAGCFLMGSEHGYDDEKPVHEVCLSAYWIGKTEVTNAQYQSCVDAGACSLPEERTFYDDPAYADHPVVYVDWQQASEYAIWVGGSLPTEAQWEYAARGPEAWPYPWGDTFDGTRLNSCDADCVNNWRDETYDDGYALTAPVGTYPQGASWVGALDMSGNVWEWVADWYDENYYGTLDDGVVNPIGPVVGDWRALRGGAFLNDPLVARCAYRGGDPPAIPDDYIGFRVAIAILRSP